MKNDRVAIHEELCDFYTIYTQFLCREGYRIVYIYKNGNYDVGAYCKTIEGFMFEFCESYPIYDDDDVPKFISVDNLLNRYLNSVIDAKSIAIYTTNGELVASKERDTNKFHKN